MYSTVQQRAYVVPTHRRAVHHSQVPFDAANSITVTSVAKPSLNKAYNHPYPSGRYCWTAATNTPTQQKPPLVIQAEPTFIRSYTTMTSPQDPSYSMPSTAVLPRTGQVKITALSQEKTEQPSMTRAKTTGCIGNSRRKTHRLGHVASNRRERTTTYDINFNHLTVGDLKSVLDTEYPVSGKHASLQQTVNTNS